MIVVVRREGPGDTDTVRGVHDAAFARTGGGGSVEGALLDRLRADPGWRPRLSLVAEVDGEPAGHVVATRARVGDHPALGLGPLGVLPAHQGRGVGTALVQALLGAAQALDETLVCLLGEPAYYSRFGFVAATAVGVSAPDPTWGAYFQARVLAAGAPTGPFRYAAPFDEL